MLEEFEIGGEVIGAGVWSEDGFGAVLLCDSGVVFGVGGYVDIGDEW